MKKSIAILVVLVITVCAFAGNRGTIRKKPSQSQQRPPVELRMPSKNKELMKPAPRPKKPTLAKQAKTK